MRAVIPLIGLAVAHLGGTQFLPVNECLVGEIWRKLG